MRGRLLFLLFLLLPATSAPAERAVPALSEVWARGETIEFSLSWLRVVGGEATMKIVPLDDARYRIHSLGQSNAFFAKIFKVRDEVESIVSREKFSTLRFYKHLQERKRIKEEVTVVDPARGLAYRKGKEIEVPNPVYDPLSLIFHLRTRPLTPGSKETFTLIADGKVYDVVAEVVRRETIHAGTSSFRTVMVEPKIHSGGIFRDEENRLFIWYTDDERHIPVRIRSELAAGAITATLRRYSVGTAKTAR